jgi:FemAB-related protein (PEP-CTERM system-associated)
MATIICKSKSEAVGNEWNEFVSASSSATISHVYSWRKIISTAYGHRSFYLTARCDDRISGILPLIQVKSRLFGNVLSSMPFQDYGGIIANNEEIFRNLLDRAKLIKNECGAESLELRHREALFPEEGILRQDKATLVLNISAGPDDLWKSFSAKLRNQVRKAQKESLSTKLGGAELLEEFYRPFAVNMRDLGSPVHHPVFFEKIFSEFGDNAKVILVHDRKQTVGGLIALFFKNTIVVPWASCYRRYFPKCPNNILYWDAIQYACSRGCSVFDFGRSSFGSGTYNFKLQWGAQPLPLNWQFFSERNPKPSSENGSLQKASAVWKHIPVVLANYLGPRIRKYLTN